MVSGFGVECSRIYELTFRLVFFACMWVFNMERIPKVHVERALEVRKLCVQTTKRMVKGSYSLRFPRSRL